MEETPLVQEEPVLVEQPVVENPIVVSEETPLEQSVVEEPIVEQPVLEQSVVEDPIVVLEETPMVQEQPVLVEQPVVENPIVVLEEPPAVQPVLVDQPVLVEVNPVRSLSDPNTFHIHIPVVKQVQYNITGFTVSPNCYVTLGKSVQINVSFSTDMGGIFHKNILLEDQDYNKWGVDDDYIYEYVKSNIVDIFKSI
jgi:hypothetical protein